MMTLVVSPVASLFVKPGYTILGSGREHHMEVVIVAATVCFVLLIAGFGVLFTKLLAARDEIFSPEDVIKEPFSRECYRAMERVLDETDRKFMSSHPGCTRQMEKNFRKRRIRIFRAYLQLLSGDFHRICKAIRLHMIACKIDRSDLAAVVMKEQFRFAVSMVYVEIKLTVYASGWSGVDTSSLICSLDAMRDRLQSLAALPEPTLA
jgi:hypothetical protein